MKGFSGDLCVLCTYVGMCVPICRDKKFSVFSNHYPLYFLIQGFSLKQTSARVVASKPRGSSCSCLSITGISGHATVLCFFYVCVCVGQVPLEARGGHGWDALELELQTIVNCPAWVWGAKQASGRVADAPSC